MTSLAKALARAYWTIVWRPGGRVGGGGGGGDRYFTHYCIEQGSQTECFSVDFSLCLRLHTLVGIY